MIQYFAQGWKTILKIGYDPSLPGLERSRTMLLNGLTAATAFTVCLFSISYKVIGYQYYIGPLYILPLAITILLLHKNKKFALARGLYPIGSLMVIIFWCYEGRGNGNEYILIAVATTSSVIFSKKSIVYLINFLCVGIFIVYRILDATLPFTPDPAIDYDIVPMIVLLSTVGVLSLQMAFFKDLVHHYDNKLSIKYSELNEALAQQQRTDEELMTTNEELTASNEQQYMLTNQLEVIVKQKSAELQSYVDAINVHIHSAVTDSKGVLLKVNKPLLEASGYAEEELLGKKFNWLISDDQSYGYLPDFWATILAGKTWRGEIKNQKKDGLVFWTDTVILPVKGENNLISYFLTLSLPITERKLQEESREKTIQLIETIAFKTSHNIRGPLTRIQGLVNLVQKDFVAVEEFKWVADKLSINAQEIDKVTAELVDFINTHQKDIQDNKIEKDKLES
jgi:PAS domain S-box-containing protein